MVLPTLPSYLELKRVNFNQDFLRNKHHVEADQFEKRTNAIKYFQKANSEVKLYDSLTSDRSFNQSMYAYSRQMEESEESKQKKKELMLQRKEKLKKFLSDEEKNFQIELKNLRINGINNSNSLSSLKLKAEALKSARENERRKLAEEKLYENWRQNNPELRELESKQLQKHVVNTWSDQIDEKKANELIEENEKQEYLKYLELERQKAEDLDLELKRLKLNREIELKEILKQQMIELKQREAESDVLNREEYELTQDRVRLLSIQEERIRLADKNNRQDYGRQLLRQHKAKLRQRAKEIQEELEFDLKVLMLINQSEDQELRLKSARRLQAKADAENMIKVLNEQLRLEKEKEAELDAMFQDEAQREWDKKNIEWKKESLAREALMKQVLEERQRQIEEKFQVLNEKKIDSLKKREELLRDMEKTQELVKREKEKQEREKLKRRMDLERQMTSRNEQYFQENIVEDVNTHEQEQISAEMYQKFLDEEKSKKIESKFEPKSFGRKKVVWT
ncbi:unnamed protein product [Brachionus calyciflorus]|uniref:Trichoplein keratin filament-binding protein n=1 Tax=Brachionus calyciflorus TaxID=104777 RepID=A0A813MKE3_9BILA|nr:unnamed protein product [Brachionus calyciflorus]